MKTMGSGPKLELGLRANMRKGVGGEVIIRLVWRRTRLAGKKMEDFPSWEAVIGLRAVKSAGLLLR